MVVILTVVMVENAGPCFMQGPLCFSILQQPEKCQQWKQFLLRELHVFGDSNRTLGFDGTKNLSVDIFELGKVEEAYWLTAVSESHTHRVTLLSRSSA